MKKIIVFVVTIFLAMTTMPVMAKEDVKTVFEIDTDKHVCETGALSVYGNEIREEVKGELAECDCGWLCFCTQLEHIVEDTTKDFYSTFFEGDHLDYPFGTVYEDCSSSMEQVFSYEKGKILKNMSPLFDANELEIKEVFRNEKTDLYGILDSFEKEYFGELIISMPSEVPIIITDLWDTAGKEESFKYFDGQVVFCVPYASSNKEGVLHCEDFVNNLLWNHDWIPGCMSIYIVYTDEVIVRYSNGLYNGIEGYIEIYVP